MRYFVHDFLFEETGASKLEDCIYFHVAVYCTHEKKWVKENSERFLISVGNLKGIATHLETLAKIDNKTFFDGPFMIVFNNSEDDIMHMIKQKIESFFGVNKRELLYKLSPFFEWEYLSDEPKVVTDLFK